jgi:ferrochelatase
MGGRYDAVLLVSFGGPEGMADVLPFLENVTRGRGVPRERLAEVARHYEAVGGVSPLNAQNRALVRALEAELAAHGPRLPVYWGNRNWHPLLPDTVRRMRDDGIARAVAFVTSAFSSYSGCRQDREDLARARDAVGAGAPELDKLRVFHDHPAFLEANAGHLRAARARVPPARRATTRVVFTAHSLPVAMARGAAYERQLQAAAAQVARAAGLPNGAGWQLAYQSRSGPPAVPWLEPDILTVVDQAAAAGVTDLVVLPLGFVSDHMEVVHDLDTEAAGRARALGLGFHRAPTAGTAPAFVRMIRELIVERASGAPAVAGDLCAADCCPPGRP